MAKGKHGTDSKEDFINNMIADAIEHTPNFRVGIISNGINTFDDLTNAISEAVEFLELNGKLNEFIEFSKNKHKKNRTYPSSDTKINHDELPFADEDYFGGKDE